MSRVRNEARPGTAQGKYEEMPYDLVKEGTIAVLSVGALVVVLSGILSTPDVPALSAQQVARQDPMLLVTTELNHLGLQDAISNYGPPYNHGTDAVQSIGPISPQQWAGVQIPVNSRRDDVLIPLHRMAVMDPAVRRTLAAWDHASSAQQLTWVANVQKVLPAGSVVHNRLALPHPGSPSYGPVPQMANDYLRMAQSGLLEAAIDEATGPVPLLNRTKALLLLENTADTAYASKLNMLGPEWGVMKETGNYPGAVWLWYYTLLYQIPPYSTSSAADLLVVLTVMVVTFILMFTPFIPGLRSLPRWLRIYRLIWRDHYRALRERGELGP